MDFFETDPFSVPVDSLLDRNLEALARTSPQAAARIRSADPRADLDFIETDEGVLSASIRGGKLLASRRKPLAEAKRLAETVDITETAGVAVVGFGLGHHLRAFAERLNKTGILMCFEPDLGLLRAVFEKIDCTEWMLRTNFALVTDPNDGAAISRTLSGLEGVIALGVKLVDHPPSKERLGETAVQFGQQFADVLKAIRTAIVTTLVQSEVTLRNLLMNLDHYAECAGIADLGSSCLGFPAVVVSAGPSLARNIDILARPGMRDRVVIIAVQTVLKPLLERGIRPHFVCALDHHEISTRFYEGLTASDVEGVTLVVEPKANPAILDAWPGALRSLESDLLELILEGSGLKTEPKGVFAPGATVAHLCYYLARHLGCDPVLLCGQDLGFTDGQYYADGAAIHNIWAGELGPFRTLEMFEWERIAREKSLLRRKKDIFGRSIFTDEQMATYLAQFEADFMADTERGLRIIDATEGGIAKRHTVPMSLLEAIEAYQSPIAPTIPPAQRTGANDNKSLLRSRLMVVRTNTRTLLNRSKDTIRLLKKLRRAPEDQTRANDLVRRIHAIRDEVTTLDAAFRLTQFINQSGSLNRIRADRAIDLESTGDEITRQKLRIDRDIANVEAIVESSQKLIELIDDTIKSIDGQPKRTRGRPQTFTNAHKKPQRQRIAAIVAVDFEQGGLATQRDIENPIIETHTPLRLTISRLLASRRLKSVICLTNDVDRLGAALGELALRVQIEPLDRDAFRRRIASVGTARRFNPWTWRGGIASLCCYDEVLEPMSCLNAMRRRSIDAAILVGADWCLTDPEIIDALIERHLESTESARAVFTQAPPGLGSLLLDRSAIQAIAENTNKAGPFATIGALLGYVPFAPQSDPIAGPMCVSVSPLVRDLMTRCIPDTPRGRERVAQTITRVGAQAGVEEIARAIASTRCAGTTPHAVTFDGLNSDGTPHEAFLRGSIEALEPGSTVTLAGDQVEDWETLQDLIDCAHEREVSVHVRTNLLGTHWESLLSSSVDVVSVDLHAIEPGLYERLTGRDGYEVAKTRVENLLAARNTRGGGGGLPRPWIVPRITRRDEAYEHIEPFYDGWLKACGCAVVDPVENRAPDARIGPISLPAVYQKTLDQTSLHIRSDGSVIDQAHLSIRGLSLAQLWLRTLEARGITAPELITTHQAA